jgi:ribosome biogenesis GTPase
VLASAASVGPRVIGASIVSNAGIPEIRALCGPGRTGILLGSSGVGKSSLLNAIAGTAQEVRALMADERGRHTTTRRELFRAPDDSLWIDTPGMRELAQWIDDDDESAFDDVTALAASCKFRDCAHRDEPGCAVRGVIAADRLASFHKLADERRQRAVDQRGAQRIAQRGKKPRLKAD